MTRSLIINDKNKKPIYEIFVTKDFSLLPEKISQLGLCGKKVCIIADSNTYPLYFNSLKEALGSVSSNIISFCFEAGELNKTLDTVKEIYNVLIEAKFDRSDYLIALGGGVVGDITGFAAATYLRGISFIQVPTTLLAQSDSSVGGKTGVDFDGYKNMVGAFCMPKLVYMNVNTLKTLDRRVYLSGMGEVIKHSIICNSDFFSWLNANKNNILALDEETLIEMDYRNCCIKGSIVEQDPTEKGIRSHLNFGHTLGHAIEKQKAGELYHGECVALGSVASTYISYKKGYVDKDTVETVKKMFDTFELPTKYNEFDIQEAIKATKNDKKAIADKIKFILIDRIGNAFPDYSVSDNEMEQGLEYISKKG